MFSNRSILRIFPVLFNVAIMMILLIGSALTVTPAYAAGIVVTSNADDTLPNLDANSTCDLREAITNANVDAATYTDCAAGVGTDTITFASNYTITLGSQLPAVTTTIIINGTGAADTIIQANASPLTATYRVFEVANNGDLSLNNLTVQNGRCNGSCATNADAGGGIYSTGILAVSNAVIGANHANTNGGGVNNSSSTAELTNVTLSGNSASDGGGGMYSFGSSLTLTNVTISNNSANLGGGMNNFSGIQTLTNVTFSGNTATTNGGGMVNSTIGPTLTNVTFSGNSATSGGGMYNYASSSPMLKNVIIANSPGGGDCVNSGVTLNAASSNNLIEDGSNACGLTNGANGNIIGSDPALGTLTGSPAYFPLNAGSPAINAGNDAVCAAAPVNNTSQNGLTRPQGAHCEIGSFELLSPMTAITSDKPDPSRVNQAVAVMVTVTGGATPTGTVDITGADTNCTITLSGGAGSCLVNFASTGPKTLIATYNGDATHDASSDTEAHIVALVASFRSIAADDGWILESGENTNAGGTMNSAATTLRMGDDATDKQYRSILSFNTASLPNNAVIASVLLQTTLQSSAGNPNFADFGGRTFVDVKTPTFGVAALELADFITPPTVIAAGHQPTPIWNLYRAYFNATSLSSVNLTGLTKLRIRFKSDDDNDNFADYLSFYSGNTAVAADRPLLQILYYTP